MPSFCSWGCKHSCRSLPLPSCSTPHRGVLDYSVSLAGTTTTAMMRSCMTSFMTLASTLCNTRRNESGAQGGLCQARRYRCRSGARVDNDGDQSRGAVQVQGSCRTVSPRTARRAARQRWSIPSAHPHRGSAGALYMVFRVRPRWRSRR